MIDYSKYSTKPKADWGRIVSWFGICIAFFLMVVSFQMVGCGTAHAEVNMEAIKQIESGGNPKAYNKSSGAMGLYQITSVCLSHFNSMRSNGKYGQRIYGSQEMFQAKYNEEVARWYFNWLQDTYGFDDVGAIIGFNAGPKRALCYRAGTCDLPKETVNYLTRYQALTSHD